MESQSLISANEAARRLGVQSDTVRKYVQRGILTPAAERQGQTGRAYLFDAAAIASYLETRRQPGKPKK